MARACSKRKPNRKEMKLSYVLRRIAPHEYRYNGDCRRGMIFGGKIPDFVNVNGHKKVIEMFGDWWHGERVTGRTKGQEESKYMNHYKKFGYSCLIVWESELNDVDALKEKVRSFVAI